MKKVLFDYETGQMAVDGLDINESIKKIMKDIEYIKNIIDIEKNKDSFMTMKELSKEFNISYAKVNQIFLDGKVNYNKKQKPYKCFKSEFEKALKNNN